MLIKCLKLVSLSNSIKTIDVKCLSDSYEEDEDETQSRFFCDVLAELQMKKLQLEVRMPGNV